MTTGIKKLQRVQFGKEVTPGTPVTAGAVWRGTGNQLDDQRKVNKVSEGIGFVTDTTRSNISQLLGMISLNSCNATYEQLPLLFSMAFGGPTISTTDGGAGSGASLTAVLTAGVITSVTRNSGGAGYLTTPRIYAYGGGVNPSFQPQLSPSLSSNSISSVSVIDGGSGYTSPPTLLVFPQGAAGSASVYQTNFPAATPVALANAAYTVVGGDNFETEQMESAVCTKIELSGDAGGEVKVSADIMGRQVAYFAGGFATASFFPNPVEDILFQKGKVYLDSSAGSYGTTQVANAIKGFKITFDIKWHPEFTFDNILYYSTSNFIEWTAKGELTYLHDTAVSGTGGGAKTFYRTQTPKGLRLDFTGAALASSSVNYSTKRCIIDLPLLFTNTGPLSDKDGVSTVVLSFDSGYDPIRGDAGKIIIVNEQRILVGVI